METLQAKIRDMADKPKKLRREGMLTGSLCGKNLEHSISITLEQNPVQQFLKKNYVSSQVVLDIDGKQYQTLVKSVDYNALQHQVLDMTFQNLVSDEKVRAIAEIIFEHEDMAQGFITRNETEIIYKAYPKDLTDRVIIDVSKYPVGTNLTVGDLDIASNPNIELETPLTTSVLHIAEHRHLSAAEQEDVAEEEAAAEEAAAAATETKE